MQNESEATSLTLLEQLKQENNDPAWQRFNAIYGSLILAWLKRRGVPDEMAADVRQNVMLKVLQEIRQFDHNHQAGAFRAWLRLIMMHRLRTEQRRNNRFGTAAPDWSLLADESSEVSQQWNAEHNRHVIDRLLEIVSAEFQEHTLTAFRRVVLQNENAETVAADLRMSVNAVRIAQSRVLAALRRIGAGFIDC